MALEPAHADRPAGFRVRPGESVDLSAVDAEDTPGFDGGKQDGYAHLADRAEDLSELQERLFAAARAGARDSVLLIVQGMDTSGKGGIMRHVIGQVDPQGVEITAFSAPTAEEKQHDFLWRIRRRLPRPGMIGVFDRSHYEDVLIHRVHGWADKAEIDRRIDAIRDLESGLVAAGTAVVKVMLHISFEEQSRQLLERIDDPAKHWKYDPGDLDEREHWDEYMAAYGDALARTSTEDAPWFVLPGDRRWYGRVATQELLFDALTAIDPQYPAAHFDVETERARLFAQDPALADEEG